MTTTTTTIIGFPRIGEKRELKFATEKYFKNKISQEELRTTAKELRKTTGNFFNRRGSTQFRAMTFRTTTKP